MPTVWCRRWRPAWPEVDPTALLETLATLPPAAVFVGLMAGSFLEYVFPPFPGDTVVVAGAVLAAAGGLGLPWVLVAVTVGAVAGTAVDWWAGRRAAARLDGLAEGRRRTVQRLVDGFERVGPALLVINRFAPGIRALFFVAAGVAGLPLGTVVAYATVSATAWNLLLVGLGSLVGWNLDALLPWLGRVGWGGAVLAAVGIGAWLVVSLRRRDEGEGA